MSEPTVDVQLASLFKDKKYRERIQELSLNGKKCIYIDFIDLIGLNSEIAKSVIAKPEEYLRYLANAAYEQLRIEDPQYAETNNKSSFEIRISHLEQTESLRFLGSEQLSKLVMVEGVVVSVTSIKPAIQTAVFTCKRCGSLNTVTQLGPFMQNPIMCQAPDCGRDGPFTLEPKDSIFVDSQEINLQERPEELPPGQLPRKLSVRLQGKELVESARPGDHVSIVGIPVAIPQNIPGVGKLRIFNLFFDANSVSLLQKENQTLQPTPEEEVAIKQLAKDPEIYQKITASIAPSIYGYNEIKEGLALILFGGVAQRLEDINIRGEINILLVGDPGIAKTQLLLYMIKIAPRGMYASGKGTTAVGLTAAVTQDKKTGGMLLQAGALVLADKGIACVDEIDKMNPDDRVALHEAMEQHRVSINKGGINATLNARTAVLAACNPSLGRYEPYKTITDNINLPVTLLSRFDLIFVIRDVPNPEDDKEKSGHVLNLHRRKVKFESIIKPELLRKYIAYSKTVEPKLTDAAIEKLQSYYLAMRSANSDSDAIAITVRQLESLVRMAEAHARMSLRPVVNAEDADAAIKLMKSSLGQIGIEADIDPLMTGISQSVREKLSRIVSILVNLEKVTGIVEKNVLLNELETKHGLPRGESERLVNLLLRDSIIYEPHEGCLKKTGAS